MIMLVKMDGPVHFSSKRMVVLTQELTMMLWQKMLTIKLFLCVGAIFSDVRVESWVVDHEFSFFF